jgi:radical SAM protein with 4Fe4S-binding SPASM domain
VPAESGGGRATARAEGGPFEEKQDNMLRRFAYRALPRLLPPSTLHWLAEHVREWENLIKRGTTCWPFDAVIELENWCNRSCWYCPQSGQKYARLEITDEMFSLALQRLREVGWDGQLFFSIFNEPFACKRIVERIGSARAALPKALININTNADYLTKELMAASINAGLDRVVITRHPPYNKNWDAKVKELMELFPGVIRMQQLQDDQLRNVAGLITKLVPAAPPTNPCPALVDVFVIRYNGDIGPCCCDYDRGVVLGNIKDNSIREIWNNEKFKRMRAELAQGIRTEKICKNCNGSYRGL